LPIEQQHHIVKIGSDYHGLLTMAMMPDSVAADYMTGIRRALVGQTTFFCNYTATNQLLVKVSLTVSSALRKRVASAFNREDAQAYADEASTVKQRLFTGRKIMYSMVGLIVHGYSPDEIEDNLLRV